MTLDELVDSIPDNESELKQSLAEWILYWKNDETGVHRLDSMLGKWHGNVWFKNDFDSNNLWKNILNFKSQIIDKIGGMTLNERLYHFSLMEIWDNSDKKRQETIKFKLLA